ncbi:MAG TPA: hypothetical protein DET40_10685 [Lentisphaeria bacterium]|nr:MAG: hypothetical protein A2X45_09595 [Lentisphaerae bacterium GWF2_50_93]HCE44004.1 hypothetical protein [Lentisphaeria bacterium]
MKELRSIKEMIEIARRKNEQEQAGLKSSEKKNIYADILKRRKEEEGKIIQKKKDQSRLRRKFFFLKAVAAMFFVAVSGMVLYGGIKVCAGNSGAPVEKGEVASETETTSAFRRVGEMLEGMRSSETVEGEEIWSPHVDAESRFYGESIVAGIDPKVIIPDSVKKFSGGRYKARYRNDGRFLSFVLDTSGGKLSMVSVYWDRK